MIGATQLPLPQLGTNASAIGGDVEKAKAAAEEFESIFLSSMLQQAFPKPTADSPFNGGQAEETWRGFMIDEYGKSIAKSGGLGLAEHIQRELLAMQEKGQ
ncbi:MAG: rod-binding protein [Hyphomicrobiales bacterium]